MGGPAVFSEIGCQCHLHKHPLPAPPYDLLSWQCLQTYYFHHRKWAAPSHTTTSDFHSEADEDRAQPDNVPAIFQCKPRTLSSFFSSLIFISARAFWDTKKVFSPQTFRPCLLLAICRHMKEWKKDDKKGRGGWRRHRQIRRNRHRH